MKTFFKYLKSLNIGKSDFHVFRSVTNTSAEESFARYKISFGVSRVEVGTDIHAAFMVPKKEIG